MDNQQFIDKCKELLIEYMGWKFDIVIDESDICVVWLTKALQNNKALLSTNLYDGKYYELTYNGDKNEIYFDAYDKFDKRAYSL